MLLIDKDPQDDVEEEDSVPSTPSSTTSPTCGPRNREDRKPLWMKFPDLVKCATDFIKSHSFSAHVRRRESTGTGTGVSLADIQEHLFKHVLGLKEHGISRDTIHHLSVAPRLNSSRAHRYKALVDCRVPGKRNQYQESSVNQHFLSAEVRYREEFVSKFHQECQFFSCDDMNKLKMGPATAVFRYHQIARFFMKDDSPNLGDHDFPNPGIY